MFHTFTLPFTLFCQLSYFFINFVAAMLPVVFFWDFFYFSEIEGRGCGSVWGLVWVGLVSVGRGGGITQFKFSYEFVIITKYQYKLIVIIINVYD